jgi:hypothetical protein
MKIPRPFIIAQNRITLKLTEGESMGSTSYPFLVDEVYFSLHLLILAKRPSRPMSSSWRRAPIGASSFQMSDHRASCDGYLSVMSEHFNNDELVDDGVRGPGLPSLAIEIPMKRTWHEKHSKKHQVCL